MCLFMELSIANLEVLKDLGFELSVTAENHRIGVHSCWGKYIAIVFGRVLIWSGDKPSYQLTPISKASELLTLFNIGITEEAITKIIKGDLHSGSTY